MTALEPGLYRATAARFWSKVVGGDVSECWLWTGTARRYGSFWLGGKNAGAHRVAYELMRADIPAGLQIDHLCRNTKCVNPWHLEPVTPQVNTQRSTVPAVTTARNAAITHCPQDHPYDEDNTYNYGPGRVCRTCANARTRAQNNHPDSCGVCSLPMTHGSILRHSKRFHGGN